MLRFHMKKKWFNFDSYLDKQRTHCNEMRKNLLFREPGTSQAMKLDKVVWGDACWENQLSWCLQVCPKLQKVENLPLKGKETATHFVTYTPTSITCLSVSRLSWVFGNVSKNCLRIHWFESVPWRISSVSRKISIGSGIVVEWTQVFITCNLCKRHKL